MVRRRLVFACLLMVAGCDKPKPAVATLQPSAVAPASTPSPRPPPGLPPPRGSAPASLPCERATQWLSVYPRTEIADSYCPKCGNCGTDAHGRWTMPWELFADDDDIIGRVPCSELAYVRYAIGAYHGESVEDAFWKPYFARQAWYAPNPSFELASLPKAAVENRLWIERLEEMCRARVSTTTVRPSDRQLVAKWFEAKRAGKLDLSSLPLFVDGEPASEKDFIQFMSGDGLYAFDERTYLLYDEYGSPHRAAGTDRVIVVLNGVPGVDCVGGEFCEGFESIQFELDAAGNIVALAVAAAACPFVYAAVDGAPLALRGEILRSLRHPALEATQTLSVSQGSSCTSLHVVLSEEKREITYVDSLALTVGAATIFPDACHGASAAFCSRDDIHHVLAEGETLAVTFTLPPGTDCSRLELSAHGYYLPQR